MKVLDEVHSKFNGELKEISSKFNKKVKLCLN
jgi:hypothetical protein